MSVPVTRLIQMRIQEQTCAFLPHVLRLQGARAQVQAVAAPNSLSQVRTGTCLWDTCTKVLDVSDLNVLPPQTPQHLLSVPAAHLLQSSVLQRSQPWRAHSQKQQAQQAIPTPSHTQQHWRARQATQQILLLSS